MQLIGSNLVSFNQIHTSELVTPLLLLTVDVVSEFEINQLPSLTTNR